MKEQHMNPEESIKAHLDLRSKLTIGMHFGTFKLTNEGINSPVEDLHKKLKEYNVTNDKFIAPKFGQLFKVQ
jgi:L-ascorbate metabolism protein UlaG (beta-lactamase superfamily)